MRSKVLCVSAEHFISRKHRLAVEHRYFGLIAVLIFFAFGAAPGVAAANYSPVIHSSGIYMNTGQVQSLILGYKREWTKSGTAVLGASRVIGSQRTNLRLGSPLGERMWRVDFIKPVSLKTAERVARQLASHPAVVFAEVDERVSALR